MKVFLVMIEHQDADGFLWDSVDKVFAFKSNAESYVEKKVKNGNKYFIVIKNFLIKTSVKQRKKV